MLVKYIKRSWLVVFRPHLHLETTLPQGQVGGAVKGALLMMESLYLKTGYVREKAPTNVRRTRSR